MTVDGRVNKVLWRDCILSIPLEFQLIVFHDGGGKESTLQMRSIYTYHEPEPVLISSSTDTTTNTAAETETTTLLSL